MTGIYWENELINMGNEMKKSRKTFKYKEIKVKWTE